MKTYQIMTFDRRDRAEVTCAHEDAITIAEIMLIGWMEGDDYVSWSTEGDESVGYVCTVDHEATDAFVTVKEV